MAFPRILLYPFSILYDAITRARNYLYDIGHKASFHFDVMVVGVGNLRAGGSGKTPMVEYLIRLLQTRYRLATLSRGYGRMTKGIRLATAADSASTIGDEPFQFYRKFSPVVLVAVGEDRAFAIPNILQEDPAPDIILMDDAFQHRSVKPQLSILLTDYSHPFYSDLVLPAGNLRERRSGASRGDVVVVSKCPPAMTATEFTVMEKSIHRYAPGKPVFFSILEYEAPIPFGAREPLSSDIVLVTGIANSKPLEDFIRSNFTMVRHFRFADHHRFASADLDAIDSFSRGHAKPVSIVTTEKDMVRLLAEPFKDKIASLPWFYIPVRVSFLKNGSDFDSLVLHAVVKHEKNNAT